MIRYYIEAYKDEQWQQIEKSTCFLYLQKKYYKIRWHCEYPIRFCSKSDEKLLRIYATM